jgi:hypothetical protein
MNPSLARKIFLLGALGTAALFAWKMGVSGSGAADKPPSSAPVATAENRPPGSPPGYLETKDAKCCDKPPSKSALMRKPEPAP